MEKIKTVTTQPIGQDFSFTVGDMFNQKIITSMVWLKSNYLVIYNKTKKLGTVFYNGNSIVVTFYI